MRSALPVLLCALLVAGCAGSDARPVTHARPLPVPGGAAPGALTGRSAAALIASFGQPSIDVQEGVGRKLQFAGPICVLDAYLYPPQNNRGEPVVTHVDARQRNGSPIDQASCAAALTRREGGK